MARRSSAKATAGNTPEKRPDGQGGTQATPSPEERLQEALSANQTLFRIVKQTQDALTAIAAELAKVKG